MAQKIFIGNKLCVLYVLIEIFVRIFVSYKIEAGRRAAIQEETFKKCRKRIGKFQLV